MNSSISSGKYFPVQVNIYKKFVTAFQARIASHFPQIDSSLITAEHIIKSLQIKPSSGCISLKHTDTNNETHWEQRAQLCGVIETKFEASYTEELFIESLIISLLHDPLSIKINTDAITDEISEFGRGIITNCHQEIVSETRVLFVFEFTIDGTIMQRANTETIPTEVYSRIKVSGSTIEVSAI